VKKSNYIFVVVALFCFFFVKSATTPELPSLDKPLIFYSAQDNLKNVFYSAIKKAKKSISLEIYGLSDISILELLTAKALDGVAIQVHYDAGASNLPAKYLKPPIVLTQHKGKGLMHKKILTIDESMVFIGSANMTTQSLKMHENLVLGIHKQELGTFLNTHKKESFTFEIGQQKLQFWPLPEPKAFDTLISFINKAEKTIHVALFTLTHPLITDALIAAKNRGIKVRCAIDHYTGAGASKKQVERLKNAGVCLYLSQGIELFHHKWALIDKKILIHGSANWTKAAFKDNKDCFIILENLDEKQKKFMKRIWKKIQYTSEEVCI